MVLTGHKELKDVKDEAFRQHLQVSIEKHGGENA